MIVVKALSGGELSGYSLMKKINEETGYWKPSPGTIYPLLSKLEKRGLLTSRTEGKKRLYSLTHKAKIFLKIADARKAAMAKYAVCCLRTYKFLFGSDVTLLMEEDEYLNSRLPGFHAETLELRNLLLLASGEKNQKKTGRIKQALRKASSEIKKING